MIYVLSGNCNNFFQDSTEKLTAGDLCLIALKDRPRFLAVKSDNIILNIQIRRVDYGHFYNTAMVKPRFPVSLWGIGNPGKKSATFFFTRRMIPLSVTTFWICTESRKQVTASRTDYLPDSTLYYLELTRLYGYNNEYSIAAENGQIGIRNACYVGKQQHSNSE